MLSDQIMPVLFWIGLPLLWGGAMILNGIQGIQRKELLIEKTRGRRLFTMKPRWVRGRSAEKLGGLYVGAGAIIAISGFFIYAFAPLRAFFCMGNVIVLVVAMTYTLALYEEAGKQ
jgi:hypothetical protein